jgi:Pilin (bacterial filament).
MTRVKRIALRTILSILIVITALWLLGRCSQDFGIRAMMSQVISAGEPARGQIEAFYQQHKRLPRDAAEAELDLRSPSRYGEPIYYDGGRGELRIVARDLGGEADGKSIVLRAEVSSGKLVWICGSYDMPAKYRGGSCSWTP